MQLDTIEVPQDIARREFLNYRRLAREQRTAEDEQMMRAYREAAKGQRLIRLPDVLRAGGLSEREVDLTHWNYERKRSEPSGEKGVIAFPRLAVARADIKHVFCSGIDRNGGVTFEYDARSSYAHETRKRFDVRGATFEHALEFQRATRKVAMVPSIPPALRPGSHLRNFHILWEAEWKVRPLPPGDPALLKHVGGDLYAVLAVWDLTPLEQAVLAGTRALP